MNHHYEDIRNRIDKEPRWWDEAAVPRYCRFEPEKSHNIYATQCALLRIACQNCGTTFLVCMSESYAFFGHSLSNAILRGTIHYGDPPNTGCCAAGPTMNCDDLDVLQFWVKDIKGWQRLPEFEGTVKDRAVE